ncbi:1-deoxy-D-xylulose-5-phosphate reductoisomerase [Candidatus Peregrinibacteria bacterium]|nr:1-deoxy-D-xylulose-5-phosphate reductoisomerase [Candidatus Peregrinibacteria bacterium]
MKRIIILGSTGSIGTQTLEIVRLYPDEFQILGLCAHSNTELFEKQVAEFKPKYVLQTVMSENPEAALMALASSPDADLIVNAIAGSAGLMPTFAAVKAGKRIALANKESLVMAGELIMELARKMGAEILPIDSEPSAIWQALEAQRSDARGQNSEVEKIILTASGGPFWKWTREQLQKVTAAQALKHPTWDMGQKISIDSATLINKAFEIIETRWIFDIPPQKIDVVIHRQSIVHSMVQFVDGNISAILSQPDMKLPISYALFYPTRASASLSQLDFSKLTLTFEKPDYSVLEGPKIAYEVLKAGGIMPAVFCMADEIAVRKFLAGEISFLGIYDFIKRSLDRVKNTAISIESVKELMQKIL